jgi:hypothetical protein
MGEVTKVTTQLGKDTGAGNPHGLRVRVSLGAGAGHHLTNPWRVGTRLHGSRVKNGV